MTFRPGITSDNVGSKRSTREHTQVRMCPSIACYQGHFMDMAIFTGERYLLAASLLPFVRYHDIYCSRAVRHGCQIRVFPRLANFHIHLMDMAILTNVCHLLTASLFPSVADHKAAPRQRGSCDSSEVYVLPPSFWLYPQFMNVTIHAKISHLLRTRFRPGIASDKSTARGRSASKRRQVCMLPPSPHANKKFVNVVILTHIHNLFRATFRPVKPN